MSTQPKIPKGWRRLRKGEVILSSDMANSKNSVKPIDRHWINAWCVGLNVRPDDMNYYYRRIAKKTKGRK